MKTNTNSSKDVQEEEVCKIYKNCNCKLYSHDDDDNDRKENMNLDCKQIQTLPKMLKMRMFVKDIRILIANCTVIMIIMMMMMMMMIATKYESRLKTNTNSSKDVQEEEVCKR